MHILVIDDELVMCELLKDLLEERNYKVTYSLSGREGIELVKKGGIDILIVDLMMPEVNGIDVLREVKKIDPDSVVVIITGYLSTESVQSAFQLGAFNYVTKPFYVDVITFVVNRAVVFRELTIANKKLTKELEDQKEKLKQMEGGQK